MKQQDFQCTITVPVTPGEAVEKIGRVSEWWAVIIRKATSDDRQTLSDFEREAGHAGRWDNFIHSRRAVVAVAECNKKLIATGYASIEHSEPFLSHAQHAFIGFLYV